MEDNRLDVEEMVVNNDSSQGTVEIVHEEAPLDEAEIAVDVVPEETVVSETNDLDPEAVVEEIQEPVQEQSPAPEPAARPAHQPYITKKLFALALIATMIASAFLATVVSVSIMRSFEDPHSGYATLSEAGSDKALSTQEIIGKNIDAVVEINTESVQTTIFGQQAIAAGAGSGVIMTEDGYIATNNHVIEGVKKITVILHNGKSYPAQLVGRDADNDIAVIKVNESGLTPATVGDSSQLTVGDQSVVIGNPLGRLGGTATEGIISALERRLTLDSGVTLDLLQTDAAINQGNSGGGLFNSHGDLVGIVVAKSAGTGIEGLAYAIPINSVASIIDDLIEKGVAPGKPSIGISISDLSEDEADYYNLDGAGTYVMDVTSEEASKAGLKLGDKIVSIDGKTFSSSSDFIARVRKHKVGDKVKLVISREGKQKEIKTTLIELKEEAEE